MHAKIIISLLFSLRGGATVEGVEVDPTPFSFTFNGHLANLDSLIVGIGVKQHPSRRGERSEHSEVIFERSTKEAAGLK